MVTVQKATIALFEQIIPLLEFFAIVGMDRDSWYSLLNTKWSAKHDNFGYVLLDEGRAVGFLGTFFSDRVVDGEEYTVCNLFCWHVLEEYRRQSLLLLRPILQLQNTTITALTSSEGATAVYQRFGFKELEAQVVIFPIRPCFPCCTSDYFITDREVIRQSWPGSS